ncbi:phage/plasmid primase, P4 family [Sinorhizobium medicae]|uniref:phage/plasmid primase, P4 family n=1 Tax=Sinorhizobium medicae TaxID=110321 RepID=UPI002AF6B7BA|nr:phage/plasmid primase, P4 family [Sinorhizobium medicae]WQO64299.1 phage/plasmid primase, P4 family [Sinorhizobium medicae]WQO90811.1 phage/plasmid primase, P4 family [Sinorhizobium medicae]
MAARKMENGSGGGGGGTLQEPKPEATGALREIDVSEVEVAFEFEERFRDIVRFDHDRGRWYEWDGSIWREQRTGRTFHRIVSFCFMLSAEFGNLNAARKASFSRGVESIAKCGPELAVTSEIWNCDPFLLGTPAGTVDLRTGGLRMPRLDDYITKATTVAPTVNADCPKWLRFLKEATGANADLIRFLRQWAGYSLTGLTTEHKLVFVFGPGGNGKSVWANTIAGIMGDYAIKAAMDTFIASQYGRHPTELAWLQGARMVHAAETDEGRSWDEAKVKELTGGDIISARFMRRDFFQFRPVFSLTIIGNFKPNLNNVDEAMRRRILIVPFTNKPKTPNPKLEEELKDEWPAILRWAIEGAQDWQENGLAIPETVKAATENYFDAQDVFSDWMADKCRAERDNPYLKGQPSKLFESWSAYAKANNIPVGTLKSFGDKLESKGFLRHRTKAERYHIGIELKSPPPPPHERGDDDGG